MTLSNPPFTAQPGSTLYYSLLFQPADQRAAIATLYTFAKTIHAIVSEHREVTVAKVKLTWWKQQLIGIYQNQASHPLALALQPVITHYQLPQPLFLALVDGALNKLEYNYCETLADLEHYCYHEQGILQRLSAMIQGANDPTTLEAATQMGIAAALIDLIADLPQHLRQHSIYFPATDLQQFAVTPEQLALGQMTNNLRHLLAFEAQRARELQDQAYQQLAPASQKQQSQTLIYAKLMRTLLDEIEKDCFNVFAYQLQLTPLRKLWIAWRQHRRGSHYFFTQNKVNL